MATDYDAPRKQDEELKEDSLSSSALADQITNLIQSMKMKLKLRKVLSYQAQIYRMLSSLLLWFHHRMMSLRVRYVFSSPQVAISIRRKRLAGLH